MEITEQKLKEILKEQREEYQRYLGTLQEDFDSKVKLLAEQYDSIRKTLESHSETLESHSEILKSHSEMIASMKEDIEIMKIDIAFIKNSLKKKVDVEEFQALESRVAVLEAKIRK